MSTKKKIKKTISIRPGIKYDGLIEKLEVMAEKESRSLNGFLLIHLNNLVKTNK